MKIMPLEPMWLISEKISGKWYIIMIGETTDFSTKSTWDYSCNT